MCVPLKMAERRGVFFSPISARRRMAGERTVPVADVDGFAFTSGQRNPVRGLASNGQVLEGPSDTAHMRERRAQDAPPGFH
jgi:hypothetical protein